MRVVVLLSYTTSEVRTLTTLDDMFEEEDFAKGPFLRSSSPFIALSRRGLNPIKPVYDRHQPDGRLDLTASAFNQLGQYTSSPGRRSYCYAELAVS